MSTDLAMNTWAVTYNDYNSTAGAPITSQIEVQAAYYAPEENLIEFKDAGHQVVFALRADIVSTIRRGGVATETEPAA